jgi:hypothetical protein
MLDLTADLAGKKTSCPECRRIIKVPELKIEKKDWRSMKTNLPSGAKQPDQPAPEGAWGSTTSTSRVSQEAMIEADAIPEVRIPITWGQRIKRGVVVVLLLGGLTGGVFYVMNLLSVNKEQQAIKAALTYANSDQAMNTVGRTWLAALHDAAAEYQRRGKRVVLPAEEQKEFPDAQKEFDRAYSLLNADTSEDAERDAQLTEVALHALDLAGSPADAVSGHALKWDDSQRAVAACLKALRGPEAQLRGYRAVGRKLIASQQAERALALAAQVFTVPAEKADALALVGLELLAGKQQPLAEKAWSNALELCKPASGDPLPVSSPVVALAFALKKEPPKPPKGTAEEEADLVGRSEGLARQGAWGPARELMAQKKNVSEVLKLRVLLGLADAGLDNASPITTDLEAALKLAETDARGKPNTTWLVLRLIELGRRSNIPEDRLRGLADSLEDPQLRGRAQLALLRDRLARSKQTEKDELADTVEPKTLSNALARLALAEHNTRRDPNWPKSLETWQEPYKAFGLLGAALGMQGNQ